MVAPADYDLTIILDGVDITTNCPFNGLSHDNNQRSPSYFSLKVERPSFVPLQGMSLIVIAKSLPDAPQIFSGFIMTIKISKRDDSIGSNLIYELEAGDNKVRLQKSVIGYNQYTGTDAEIIADMFADAYPLDLADFFDFSGLNSFASDLNFETNDESLLDALNRFADKTGANLWTEPNASGDGQIITFNPEADSIPQYETGLDAPTWQMSGSLGGILPVLAEGIGNPGQCIQWEGTTAGTGSQNDSLAIEFVESPATRTLANIRFDYYLDSSHAIAFDSGGTFTSSFVPTNDAQWHSVDWIVDIDPTVTWPTSAGLNVLRINLPDNTVVTIDVRIDNFEIITDTDFTNSSKRDKFNWDNDFDFADFDFDIDLSDEFGAGFDLNLGAIDDYNSVTVVGGKQTVAVDEALEADGSSVYMKLPFKVRSLAVYKNTGSDATPSWTAQTLGVDGTDTVGSKDVLYNAVENFLYFNDEPPNMRKAVRITGFREQPIRVRVENIGDGDPTFATVVTNENITSEEDAVAYANSLLAKKNAPRRMDFTTYEPGLKPGQTISITDSNRGLSETLVIRRIATKWIGSKNAEFAVECGEDENDGLDTMLTGIEKKIGGNSPQANLTTPVINYVYDEDGSQVYDEDGGLVYESS